jgi:hypothetical protein
LLVKNSRHHQTILVGRLLFVVGHLRLNQRLKPAMRHLTAAVFFSFRGVRGLEIKFGLKRK